MSEFLPVKSIYTGADVTALGEAQPGDVMRAPDGGIKYPDGSIQLSASGASSGTLVEESPPTANPTTLWFESDSGRMYLKYKNPDDTEVWVEANVAGVRGQTGEAGPQGPVGPAGPQGIQGEAGVAGADGADGATGPAGADGAQGIQGEVGPQGPAGANGADSTVPGPQGPPGPSDWNAIPNIPALVYNDGGTYGINITGYSATTAAVNNDVNAMAFHWRDDGTKPAYIWGSDDAANVRLVTPGVLLSGYYDAGTTDARYVYKTGDTMTGPLSVVAPNASVGLNDTGGNYAAYGLGCDGITWGTFFAARASNYVIIGTDTERDFVLKTNNVDRGRFTSNGQFLVGFSDQTGSNGRAGTVAAAGYNTKPGVSPGLEPYTFNMSWNGQMQLFVDDINLGVISLTSDYRIKSNVAALGTALDKVMALKPITYTMKAVGKVFKESPRAITGFLAHECEHIEGAVEGVKDELNVNGDIQPQRLNPMPLIATLAKAVQEQQALIESLQTRLAALESA